MATWAIDDGDGNLITCGLSEDEAPKVAQNLANKRQQTVYLYEDVEGAEYEEIEPE